jgi:hypothetical protein
MYTFHYILFLRDEVGKMRDWRNLHNEELHKGTASSILEGIQKEKDH